MSTRSKSRGVGIWVVPAVAAVQTVAALWVLGQVTGILGSPSIVLIALACVAVLAGTQSIGMVDASRSEIRDVLRVCARKVAPSLEAVAVVLGLLYLLTTCAEAYGLVAGGAGINVWVTEAFAVVLRTAYVWCMHAGALSWVRALVGWDRRIELTGEYDVPVVGIARFLRDTR